MAARTLSEEEVRRLAEVADPQKPLAPAYLADVSEAAAWRAVAFVVRVRTGGFMVALPVDERVSAALENMMGADGSELALVREVELSAETPRRRPVGILRVLLADVGWEALPAFKKAATGRGGPEMITMQKEGAIVRPTRSSAMEVSEAWIAEVFDDPALNEYVTANEDQEDGEQEEPPPEIEETPEQAVIRLQARVRTLEARHQPATGANRPGATRGARPLFPEHASGALGADDWDALRQAAGPPPGS